MNHTFCIYRCVGESFWDLSDLEKEKVGLDLFTCVHPGSPPNPPVCQFLTRKMSVVIILDLTIPSKTGK